jgi:hypothetical protein
VAFFPADLGFLATCLVAFCFVLFFGFCGMTLRLFLPASDRWALEAGRRLFFLRDRFDAAASIYNTAHMSNT